MKRTVMLAVVLCFLAWPSFAQYCRHCSPSLEVAVIGDDRGTLEVLSDGIHRCRPYSSAVDGYVEAVRGERYTIRVTNSSHQWLGIVISVDGRNIVSGKSSSLSAHEGMYVLAPHSSGSFPGWRTNLRQVQRFYFTDQHDSYAGAFGDYSQMGTIKIAAFASRHRQDEVFFPQETDKLSNKVLRGGARAEMKSPSVSQECAPGTGYGESQYSPVERIDFEPEHSPLVTWAITYRWTSSPRPFFHHDRFRFPQEERPSERFAPPPPR